MYEIVFVALSKRLFSNFAISIFNFSVILRARKSDNYRIVIVGRAITIKRSKKTDTKNTSIAGKRDNFTRSNREKSNSGK